MTDLPFVYTIFSLLALRRVADPRVVAGLAGYSAIFLKDMAAAERVGVKRRVVTATRNRDRS